MPAHVALERIAAVLPGLASGGVRPSGAVTCRVLPGWTHACGIVERADGEWLVYVARAVDAIGDAMEQAVFDVPDGRYLVDVFDIAAGAWRSRESAAAPPLVVGVPAGAGDLVVRLTRVGAATR